MTYVDMNYTSLFWRLGFVEETTNIYIKNYSDSYQIEKGVLIKYMGERDKIAIPSNVQRIGTGAFLDCTILKSVEIPNAVKCIGGDAF
jgi:hypothetical protein